jgi:amidohydrolase
MEDIKKYVNEQEKILYDELFNLSLDIHSHPEIAWKEFHAHEVLTNFMEKHGFKVTRHAFDLETAFMAEFSTGEGANVGYCSEYDALPNLGHGCGHNLIAISGVTAALETKLVLEKFNIKGTVRLYGTPAEEGEGGKVYMVERNAFDASDVMMMLHPGTIDYNYPVYLALDTIKVEYFGRGCHGSIPYDGINALDAIVSAYTNIGLLRQYMKPTARVHGIITNGGVFPNIIPEYTSGHFYVRAINKTELKELTEKVVKIFEAAGMATGCKCKISFDKQMADIQNNSILSDAYKEFMEAEGVTTIPDRETQQKKSWGSTDMGNVTYVKPSFHNIVNVGCEGHDIHTEAFRDNAKTPEAFQKMIRGAKCMALTGVKVLTDPEFLKKAQEEFKQLIASQ